MFVDLLNTGTKVFITSMSFESPFSELLHQSFSAQLSEAVIVEYLGCVDFGERLKSNSRPSTFERIDHVKKAPLSSHPFLFCNPLNVVLYAYYTYHLWRHLTNLETLTSLDNLRYTEWQVITSNFSCTKGLSINTECRVRLATWAMSAQTGRTMAKITVRCIMIKHF